MAVIGSIGDIAFEASSSLVRTFDSYADSVSARIGSHEVGGSMPVLEYIGPGTRAIEIPVRLNSALGVDVESDIEKAQAYSSSGQLLSLVIGGKPIGGAGAKWLIESVDVDRSKFTRAGAAILAEMKLSLKLARISSTPAAISQTIMKKNTQKVRTA
ncbi:MAG: phage tail protein [Armatimonadota bacterium]